MVVSAVALVFPSPLLLSNEEKGITCRVSPVVVLDLVAAVLCSIESRA